MDQFATKVVEQLRESARVKLDLAESPEMVVQVARSWVNSLQSENKILFCGNGGSAADSQHLAAELVGRFHGERSALPAIALTVDSSILTAISNDYGFDHLFVRQVQAHGSPGDVLVGLTTSGGSVNVLNAFAEAKRMGITTVAFTGSAGIANNETDYVIAVPSLDTPRIQEAHIAIGHIICAIVEEIMFPHLVD